MSDQPPRIYTEEDLERKRKNDSIIFNRRDELNKKFAEGLLTAEMLRDKAKLDGKWLYDPKHKQWYTPEHFVQIFKKHHEDHDILRRVQIMHPLDGIYAGYKQLTALQERLRAFTREVIDYYFYSKPWP